MTVKRTQPAAFSLFVLICVQRPKFPVVFSLTSHSELSLDGGRAPRSSAAVEIAAVASLLHKGQFSCFITS